jgi:hypothetical protein
LYLKIHIPGVLFFLVILFQSAFPNLISLSKHSPCVRIFSLFKYVIRGRVDGGGGYIQSHGCRRGEMKLQLSENGNDVGVGGLYTAGCVMEVVLERLLRGTRRTDAGIQTLSKTFYALIT